MKPAKDAEIVHRFHDAVAKGLAEGGVKVIPAATVRTKSKAPCAETRCGSAALTRFLATEAVVCTIGTVGKNYTIKLTLVGKSGSEASVDGRCDICTLMEALATTRKLAKQLGAKAAPVAGTKPPVKKGGKVVTTKPPPKKSVITTHSPTKPGPARATAPTTSPKKTEGRVWPLWPALAAAGVGVLGLAVGIPLLAIDGDATNCRGAPRPDNRNCQDVYSTSGGGWVMTTMGLAGLATSGVLFYLYFTSRKSSSSAAKKTADRLLSLPRVSIAPTEDGLFVGASGRF